VPAFGGITPYVQRCAAPHGHIVRTARVGLCQCCWRRGVYSRARRVCDGFGVGAGRLVGMVTITSSVWKRLDNDETSLGVLIRSDRPFEEALRICEAVVAKAEASPDDRVGEDP
jgi:hypothetical protein